MRVMSFNLRSDFILDFKNRWDDRKHIVYEIIDKYKCDIIGVQEVNNKMYEDITSNIKNYNIIGSARSKKFFSERNNLFIEESHNILKHKTFWLSKNPNKVGSQLWYSLYPRICTTAVVELKTGEKVRIYNTHLDCFLPQARDFGLKKLGEFVEKNRKEEKLPVIIMGDFNATPNSKIIKKFAAGEYNTDRFVAVQEVKKELYSKSTMSSFKGKEKGLHIDYIFVSEDLEIVDVDIVKDNINGKYPSDHYPLIADIRIKNK
ncbi:MAG: endonuclease/exonuclease/phosphatase family protein [Clostridium celatum]|nr:endonuclease/exonuclease/phosphatase family protein [Clostridium celatum]MDU4979999.1 endonuclease/exonuclease/phosphatase family protein [Clostridium celatum]